MKRADAQRPRAVVVYSDLERPDTTGGYCLRALSTMADVRVIHPSDLLSLAPGDADLFLRVDDDLDFAWPQHLRPSAYWAIDTHRDYSTRLNQARQFDRVFCAQQSGAERMRADGVDAIWLPLACDPIFHGRRQVEKTLDLCMIGSIFDGHPRSDLVSLLQAHFPQSFFGRRSHEEIGLAYSEARLVFNRSAAGDLNMRVFEALCSGTMLLTDEADGMSGLFQAGRHLVTYASPMDLLEKVGYYLSHEDERNAIGEAGRAEVLPNHTYEHRMKKVLAAFGLLAVKKARRAATSNKRIAPAATAEPPSGSAPGAAPPKSSRKSRRLRAEKTSPTAPSEPAPDQPRIIRTPESGPYSTGHYFNWGRPDVLARVPLDARRVLDVGCAGGMLGRSIKERAIAAGLDAPEVTGIEVDPQAAAIAHDRLDRVITGDIESLLENRAEDEAPFDCIILADSLEHLRRPEKALTGLRQWLTPDGVLVLSVPNVRHREVMQGLAKGRWTYTDAGLLDRTHLRFFTRRDLEQALFRAGFSVQAISPMLTPEHQGWVDAGCPGNLQFGSLGLSGLDPRDAEEFFTYQWIVTARARQLKEHGLTSMIILACNQVELTRACVESIRRHTHEPYELIFVDNGSADGTMDYLQSLPSVTIVRNEENLGFPRGCNQGIEQATGKYILLLNNDTVVTEGWLTRMLDALYSGDNVGAVGPRSHGVAGPQGIPGKWPAVEDADSYAWDLGRIHGGRRFPLQTVIGFCFLARTEAFEKVGPLDERFGLGLFEDNDISRRLREAGCRLLCAADAYVYHHLSRTYRRETDMPALFENSKELYFAKWGAEPEQEPVPADFRPTGEPIKLPPLPKKPRISLCMIVRNEEANIGPCLDSIRGGVDEMIVVDTGSTDRTAALARKHGAKVKAFPWCDDFAAARNASLSYATGDWILWMDADDRMPAEHLAMLRELARPSSPEIGGYLFVCRCPGRRPEEPVTIVHHLRLFRRHKTIRFEHRIHEQVLPSIRRAGLQVAFAPVEVIHSGYDWTPEGQEQKRERDLRILALEIADFPDHPFALYNQGMTYNALGRWDEAIHSLQRCIALSGSTESHLRKAYGLLVNAYHQRHGADAGLLVALDGLEVFPHDPELLFRAGELFRLQGDAAKARPLFERLLEHHEEDHCTSVDVGILSYRTRHALALALRELGEKEKAELQLRRAVGENPLFVPAWAALAELLLEQGDRGGSREAVDRLLQAAPGDPGGLTLRGQIAAARGDHASARKDLATAVALQPGDARPRRSLAQVLLQARLLEEAERELRALIAIHRGDTFARHNLATLCHETGRAEEAVEHYRAALAQRPDDVNVHAGIAAALRALGDSRTAAHHLQQVVRLAPDQTDALYSLGDVSLSLGNPEFAHSCFRRVLQFEPSHLEARSALAALGAF